MISIHAPTRGATFSAALRRSKPLNFNPRSHEGSDNIFYADKPSELYFNPRSHEGSDDNGRVLEAEYLNFNPRSHEGSDHKRRCGRFAAEFQSTLPRGERQFRSSLTRLY